MAESIAYAVVIFTIFCASMLLILLVILRTTPEDQRMIDIVKSNRPDQRQMGKKERFEEGLYTTARVIRSWLGMKVSAKSIGRLTSAGFRSAAAPDIFFAAQFLIPLLAAFAGSFIPINTLFWVFALAAIGYIAPNFWLTDQVSRRKERIRRSLPDAIDLLVICVDAGLGLDQALLRVTEELALSHPDIQEEFSYLHLEQSAGRPRLETWQNLASRTRIAELSTFASMLTQTDRFGTPIAKVLNSFAEDLRWKRHQRAQEAAAKAKIKIIFPLVFCIFPCLFIVLLGPALISISSSLKAIGK